MCGIAGIVTINEQIENADSIIKGMNDVQKHRGPDDEGIWLGKSAVFGHRRLSIIDLSENGRQPMTNEDGSLVLVCNGEIYNYQSLRQELEYKGHVFKSRTDIEVILHLYEEHGDDCVRHLVGMFAFGLWDVNTRRLLLARDRIGEKPLYYTRCGKLFCFASEIKALLQVPGVERRLDDEAVTCLLIYQSTPAPVTFLKDIRLLPPASTLIWQNNQIQLRRYWHIDFSAQKRKWKWNDAIQRYEELLKQSIKSCCLADVPVGVMLSGGIDSSTIAIHASLNRKDILTFCVGYEGDGRSDPEFQRASVVAKITGTKHYNIKFRPAGIALLPSIIKQYDQPFNVFPMLYAHQLSYEISKYVKVVLGGNGADEIFGGYRGYNQQLILERLLPVFRKFPSWIFSFLLRSWIFSFLSRDIRDRLPILPEIAKLPVAQIRSAFINAGGQRLASRLFTADYIKKFSEYLPWQLVNEYTAECSPRDYLDAVMYSDLMIYHQHGTTTIADVSGMSHGLEIRSPFLDHRLIEFAATLPHSMTVPHLFAPNKNKLIMKRALEPYLPRHLIYARKMGFGYNIDPRMLIRNEWRQVIDSYVLKGRYRDLGIFSEEGVRWGVEHSHAYAWMLLVFSIWSEMYLYGETEEAVTSRMTEILKR